MLVGEKRWTPDWADTSRAKAGSLCCVLGPLSTQEHDGYQRIVRENWRLKAWRCWVACDRRPLPGAPMSHITPRRQRLLRRLGFPRTLYAVQLEQSYCFASHARIRVLLGLVVVVFFWPYYTRKHFFGAHVECLLLNLPLTDGFNWIDVRKQHMWLASF